MKPVIGASQIAAQAYAQRVGQQPRVADVQVRPAEAKTAAPVRRLAEENEAFRLSISKEALEAASRDGGGGNKTRVAARRPDVEESQSAERFEPVQVELSGAGRREAPFAHNEGRGPVDQPVKRPGSYVDIRV